MCQRKALLRRLRIPLDHLGQIPLLGGATRLAAKLRAQPTAPDYLGEAFELGGRWAGARFEGILEYVIQNNRFGNAIIAQLAVTLPFDY